MGFFSDGFQPLKCPRCKWTVIKLIKEHVPKRELELFPKGVCKRCKDELIKKYQRILQQ